MMCEVRLEELRCSSSDSSLLMVADSQWLACGRKLHKRNSDRGTRGKDGEARHTEESFIDLPVELCDPMRRKITLLKPSLTPGAGTRIMRRRRPMRQEFMEVPTETEEAFRQWREGMRAMARQPEGIPAQFRSRIWLLLATHQLNSQHINWSQLTKTLFAPHSTRVSEAEERLGRQIEKDLHRTGSGIIVATEVDRIMLKRVLTAYARWNRRVGYCQGFNILASIILNVMGRDEEAALKVMIFLIDYVLPESYFARNLQALSVDLAVFRDLLALRQPVLAAHLENMQRNAAIEALHVTPANRPSFGPPLTDLFAIQWFVTLFSTCLPMSTVLRIWDAVLLEGSEVGLRAGLVVMEILSQDLMKLSSADMFYSSMNQWMEKIAGRTGRPGVETMDFIRLLYDIAPLPWPRLGDLRKRYAAAVDGRREEAVPALYGDGYDEEAKTTKTKWWHFKSRQAPEGPSKSPSTARIQLVTVPRGGEGSDTKPAVDASVAHQQGAVPSEVAADSAGLQGADLMLPWQTDVSGDTDKLQIIRRSYRQPLEELRVSPLAVNNEHWISQRPEERPEMLRRTSYHFDDSFLQTINEWRLRNAAGLSTGASTESEASSSPVSSSKGSPLPKLQRTLLSIVEEKRMRSPTNLKTDETKSSTGCPRSLLSRSSVLAKTLVRDRTRPKESLTENCAHAKGEEEEEEGGGNIVSPSPESPPSEQRPAPPWAAAMAAVAATPRPLGRLGTV